MTPYMMAIGMIPSGRFMRLINEMETKAVCASRIWVGSDKT